MPEPTMTDVYEYVPETPEIADLFAAYSAATTLWALNGGAPQFRDAMHDAQDAWRTARRRHAAT